MYHRRSAPDGWMPWRVSQLEYIARRYKYSKKGKSWVPKDPPELQKNPLTLCSSTKLVLHGRSVLLAGSCESM